MAEFEKLMAENRKLKDENAKRRVKEAETAKAKQAALQEQGEFKKLAESLQAERDALSAQIADLEALRAGADAWSAHVEAEKSRIADAAKGLTQEQRELIEATDNVALQAKMLAQFSGSTASVPEPRSASQTGPSADIDFTGLTGAALIEAKQKDPQGFLRFIKKNHAAGASNGKGIRGMVSGIFGDS